MYRAQYREFNKISDCFGFLSGNIRLKFITQLIYKNKDGKLVSFHQQYQYKDSDGNTIKSINRNLKWRFYFETVSKVDYKSFGLNYFDILKLEAIRNTLITTSLAITNGEKDIVDEFTVLLSYDRICKFSFISKDLVTVTMDLMEDEVKFHNLISMICLISKVDPITYCSGQMLYATTSNLVTDEFIVLDNSYSNSNNNSNNNPDDVSSGKNIRVKKKSNKGIL